MPLALCRIKDGWTNQDSVLIRYNDGTVQELPARRYVEGGYLPLIADLIPCPGNDVEDYAKGIGSPSAP
jgi:hypothetical protein